MQETLGERMVGIRTDQDLEKYEFNKKGYYILHYSIIFRYAKNVKSSTTDFMLFFRLNIFFFFFFSSTSQAFEDPEEAQARFK